MVAESVVLERRFAGSHATLSASNRLQRQRVYIFPTRFGLLFAAMIGVMLIGGINYNNSMAYVLTFILSSILMIGILYTYRNLAGLVFTAQLPEAVFSGQTAHFPILIDNRDQNARYSIQLTRQRQPRKSLSIFHADADLLIDIPENCLHRISLQREMQQRGVVPYGKLRISTTFPLGLFRAWAWYEVNTACIVYPKPAGFQPMPESIQIDQQDHVGTQRGTDDFIGFRNYRDGDASHSIAWKQYARERGFLVTRFQGQGSRKLIFSTTQVKSAISIETVLSQLCQWIIQAEQQGLLYGLDIDGFQVPVSAGERHQQQCLEALARYENNKRDEAS